MGVPVCWIIDPARSEGWVATPGRLEEATDGILRAGGIEMAFAEVLRDQLRAAFKAPKPGQGWRTPSR
jgi:hypothetical protein